MSDRGWLPDTMRSSQPGHAPRTGRFDAASQFTILTLTALARVTQIGRNVKRRVVWASFQLAYLIEKHVFLFELLKLKASHSPGCISAIPATAAHSRSIRIILSNSHRH